MQVSQIVYQFILPANGLGLRRLLNLIIIAISVVETLLKHSQVNTVASKIILNQLLILVDSSRMSKEFFGNRISSRKPLSCLRTV